MCFMPPKKTDDQNANTDDNKPLSFDDTLSRLEDLVTQMEDGKLSLEDALSAFETGIRLTRECQQALQQAELKVQILTSPDGQPVPMASDDEARE
jgi:exodeoxyribonuclease VII small subunit